MDNAFIEKIKEVVGEKYVKENESMASHCTFRCGGNAELFVTPGSIDELTQVVALCRENDVEFLVIGNGSNLLVSDQGYRGVIIQLDRNMEEITVDGTEIRAAAGALLSSIAVAARRASLAGFEFAGGIPGTLGGAVVMNAGAYGGEMKDVLKEVTVMTGDGEIRVIPASELEMGYRTSIIKKAGYLVLGATISLKEGNLEEIKALTRELSEKRTSKQPLEFPSAGSTFKRPEGYFAGKLIMDSGLRGYQIGGARVSDKHCGFVINAGDATAQDVVALMNHVTEVVREKYGVTLEPEVKFLGDFN